MVRILTAILIVLAVPALPALAKDKGDSGKGKHKGPPQERSGGGDGGGGNANDRDEWRDHRDSSEGDRDEWEYRRRDDDWRRFSDDDRRWWRDYWRDQYAHGHCPPGLAKKRNGCLPPGQAKKRYTIGRPLPPGVVILAVPDPLLGRLPPLERGYRYGMIDGDLVKLAIGTSLVVDAIDGLMR